MFKDLKRFMTEEEKKQISQLLDRAERRMKRQELQQSDALLFLDCQCEMYKQMPEERRKPEGSCMADMQQLLDMVCQFCQDHGCCRCSWKGDEREEEEDELPF